MVSARRIRSSAKPGPFEVTDEVFARSIARVKAMTPTQRRQSLIDAGILTKQGNYTKPYRESGSSRSHAAAR